MSKYVLCLGDVGRRRAMARLLQRKGYDALACDGRQDTLRLLRERGLPSLILCESPGHLRRARESAPGLYEVGALSFTEFLSLRTEARALDVLLPAYPVRA